MSSAGRSFSAVLHESALASRMRIDCEEGRVAAEGVGICGFIVRIRRLDILATPPATDTQGEAVPRSAVQRVISSRRWIVVNERSSIKEYTRPGEGWACLLRICYREAQKRIFGDFCSVGIRVQVKGGEDEEVMIWELGDQIVDVMSFPSKLQNVNALGMLSRSI
ncbi:hypothetical protein C8R44DRAFT_732831 [Mycena epipterygia]|nr:hypothetical protein C8R44DRAFT_732831 [Mycena epipterygia]